MGSAGEIDDPEHARVEALLDKAAVAGVTDAESEELALYAAADPALKARVEEAGRRQQLGAGWLERVRKDDAIAQAERAPRVRLERIAGVGLAGLGYALHFVLPVVAIAMVASGVGLLLYSFIRVRAKTYKDDPYKDVQR